MAEFKIGGHQFVKQGTPDGPYILAEIGLNHNGDYKLAREMVQAASECKASGVKFQSCNTEGFLHPSLKEAFEIFKGCEFKREEWQGLRELCDELEIDFISTPLSLDYVSILDEIGVAALKIASCDMTYYDLIESCARTSNPVIISTGMSSLEEILHLNNQEFLKSKDKIFLHCISNYPPRLEDCHLNFIPTLISELDCPVGLSDHTMGTSVSIGAVALGAVFIEKHFTLDRSLPGPDHKMSILPADLEELVKGCKDVHRSLGLASKPDIEGERPVREIARRGLYTRSGKILKGQKVNNETAVWLRPPNECLPQETRLLDKEFEANEELFGGISKGSFKG